MNKALRQDVEAIFMRKGAPGLHTNLWSSLHSSDSSSIARKLVLCGIKDDPVIASVVADNFWCAFSMTWIAWQQGANLVHFPMELIKSVKNGLLLNPQAAPDQLGVETVSGDRFFVTVEAGLPLGGMWNALLLLVRGN